jgi:predicted phage-related endonuclease
MSEKYERTVTHQVGVLSEDFQHKFDIVIEGQQMLSEKVDRLDEKIDRVEEKLGRRIDAVAADLAVHCADTEAHNSVYRVRERRE